MHKICLKTKQKCFKNSKFWFSPKSLRNVPTHRKLVPNHSMTLRKWLESVFDHLNEFYATFQKSNSRPQKAIFAECGLRRLENEGFHVLQNMLGESWKWAFWCRHDRGSKFIYSLEASPFRIFNIGLHFWKKNSKSQNHLHFLKDLCIKYA